MDKLFIDSNVLFAAVFTGLKGSYPSLIIQLGRLNFFELYISRLVEAEVKRNLSKKKPDNLKLLSEVLEGIYKLSDVCLPLKELETLTKPDKIILSTAIYHNMDFFITGNTRDFHYLLGRKIINTRIVTPKEFFDIKNVLN